MKTNLKNQLCSEFGISDKTFYNKLNRVDGNDFDNLQKKRISELTGISIEILFPETKEYLALSAGGSNLAGRGSVVHDDGNDVCRRVVAKHIG